MTTTTERPKAEVTAGTKTMPIADITVHPQYRRQGVGKLRDLQHSIRNSGLLRPVPVTADGMLIAGERRLYACRNLGWSHVPVVVADDNTHAVQLLKADVVPGSCEKPRSAAELALVGLRIEDFERAESDRRRAAGNAHRQMPARRQAREIAAEIVGLPLSHYVHIRIIALAALGLEPTTGGWDRVAVDADWAKHSRQTLALIDRVWAGEYIEHTTPTGKRWNLTISAIYDQWAAERSQRRPETASQKNISCNDSAAPEPAFENQRQAPRRNQREALASALSTLTGLCHGLSSITEIDPAITREEAAAFNRDLSNASRVLRGLHSKIKEYANGSA